MQTKRFMGGLVLIAAVSLAADRAPQDRMTGFSPAAARAEREVENRFTGIPSPAEARKFHRYLTAEPHPAGSERNNQLAQYIADLWREQGWEEITLHRYDVLVSDPREIVVEMTSPVPYRAKMREDPYGEDPDTRNPNVRGGYLALSMSGEVTAPVVYANSGNPEDYEVLRRQGIEVRGKIVLVRYSNPYSYRGFKALMAQRHGAAAILIYSDPAEDGYAQGKVFPDGPWGPESHIQRGAITYDFMVAGDPLTPGWASLPGAKRITTQEAVSLPHIMAAPLSWHDAKPLLENMGGPVAPKEWQGGLKMTYRMGGAARVHMKVDMDTRLAPNYVVEARIRGTQFPDEWILMGNHRDAWEFGGVDPSSGTASMLEMSRALGILKKQGIRPRRTLVACSWDGEEVGLTGSTEWGEQYADELKKKLVAYINVDSSTSGPKFEPTAVGSLAPLVVEVSRSLMDPSGRPLYQVWRENFQAESRALGKKEKISDARMVDTRIGSGSDHTVFLNFLGRPTIGLTFEGPYGVYHSVYDGFYWMNRFGDPGYRYHILLAQVWGVIALRLANAEVLPFDFASYAADIGRFLEALAKGKDLRKELDLRPAQRRIAELQRAGDALKRAIDSRLNSGPIDPAIAGLLNQRLMAFEGNWLNPEGIPGRPWFKHMLYASRFTYAHLELPGLTEAIENGNWQVAREQARILEGALARNIQLLVDSMASVK